MTIAFYLDEDAMRISLRRALQSCNFDVQSAFEAGMVRRTDEEQLEVATDQGRVLYSFNVADFSRIHADWLSLNRPHAGIVRIIHKRVGWVEQTQASVGLRPLRRFGNPTNVMVAYLPVCEDPPTSCAASSHPT